MGALTGRQAAFASYYAATGNGAKSALLAGYREGRGLRSTASRLINDPNISKQVARLRENTFAPLKKKITDELYGTVLFTLKTGINYPRAFRAQRLLARLGVFDHSNKLSQEIRDLEDRYGASIEEILDAMAVAEAELDLDGLLTEEPAVTGTCPSDL